MTDSNDPFADRPYTPRDQRDDAHESSDARPTEADAGPSGSEQPPAPAATSYPTGHEYAEATNEAPLRDHDVTEQIDTGRPTTEQPTEHTSQWDREPTTNLGTASTGAAAASASEYGQPSGSAPSDPFVPSDTATGAAAFGTAGSGIAGSGTGGSGDGGATSSARRPRRGRTLIAAVAIAALAGAAGYGGSYLQGQNGGGNGSAPISSLDSGNQATQTNLPASAVEQVASKVLPSVVQVNVKGSSESGSGTGIIISSDGEILTNNHVVAPAADGGTVTVAFSDGTNVEAEIVGRDPVTDVAVIKAQNQSGLQPATLGSSADLKVGQDVVAIGSPFGLESTVTTGIVSALNRPVTSSDGTGAQTPTVFPAVQTDAAINPGNSGGPLVDLDGNVIGINSAIRAGSSGGGQSGSIGLGFAIPVDLAKNISQQILAGDEVEHAQIGVTVRPAVSGDEITGIGAEINAVSEGSAGAEAGLQEGDIITAVNGNPVASSDALVASIRAYQPGESVEVTLLRDNESQNVDVELGSDLNAG
ncbi:S1C family serine protease [Aeromicrobium sp. CF3.5]|uniref:S1C family serine protease n=1 Tax=Aeromicrobium sp. CF3.5 TaxID=3373078 RepID=UPI003EE5AB72